MSPSEVNQVEALLLAAEHYVEPSSDLRPRVLEAARRERTAQELRRRLPLAGAAVLLVAGLGSLGGSVLSERLEAASARQRVEEHLATQRAVSAGAGVEGLCWGLVEAFFAVRKEQAAAFKSDTGKPSAVDLPLSEASAAQMGEAAGS